MASNHRSVIRRRNASNKFHLETEVTPRGTYKSRRRGVRTHVVIFADIESASDCSLSISLFFVEHKCLTILRTTQDDDANFRQSSPSSSIFRCVNHTFDFDSNRVTMTFHSTDAFVRRSNVFFLSVRLPPLFKLSVRNT